MHKCVPVFFLFRYLSSSFFFFSEQFQSRNIKSACNEWSIFADQIIWFVSFHGIDHSFSSIEIKGSLFHTLVTHKRIMSSISLTRKSFWNLLHHKLNVSRLCVSLLLQMELYSIECYFIVSTYSVWHVWNIILIDPTKKNAISISFVYELSQTLHIFQGYFQIFGFLFIQFCGKRLNVSTILYGMHQYAPSTAVFNSWFLEKSFRNYSRKKICIGFSMNCEFINGKMVSSLWIKCLFAIRKTSY